MNTCLEVHDLAVSRLVAGREKDLGFVSGLLRHRLAKAETVRDRLAAIALDESQRQPCLARVQRLTA